MYMYMYYFCNMYMYIYLSTYLNAIVLKSFIFTLTKKESLQKMYNQDLVEVPQQFVL